MDKAIIDITSFKSEVLILITYIIPNNKYKPITIVDKMLNTNIRFFFSAVASLQILFGHLNE